MFADGAAVRNHLRQAVHVEPGPRTRLQQRAAENGLLRLRLYVFFHTRRQKREVEADLVKVIEPLRAFDGKCGPPNNNATCIGTDKQCCNSQTWTCGDSADDCGPGTCYEGVCDGDIIYSTDGTCGQDHGLRSCAGLWGNCCSRGGQCGTGPAYCGLFACQEGDCDRWKDPPLPEGTPWTPDGTCGGVEGYRCSHDVGRCCNANGICGENPADCFVERGCQPAFGICASSDSPTDPASDSIPARSVPKLPAAERSRRAIERAMARAAARIRELEEAKRVAEMEKEKSQEEQKQQKAMIID